MTREEILAKWDSMSSRERDALIAEKVMNVIAWEEKRGEYTHVVFQSEGEREPFRRSRDWEEAAKRYRIIPFSEINRQKHVVQEIPKFSTEIESAFRVANRFWSFEIRKGPDGAWWICRIIDEDGVVTANESGSTAPEAICKAALLAVCTEGAIESTAHA